MAEKQSALLQQTNLFIDQSNIQQNQSQNLEDSYNSINQTHINHNQDLKQDQNMLSYENTNNNMMDDSNFLVNISTTMGVGLNNTTALHHPDNNQILEFSSLNNIDNTFSIGNVQGYNGGKMQKNSNIVGNLSLNTALKQKEQVLIPISKILSPNALRLKQERSNSKNPKYYVPPILKHTTSQDRSKDFHKKLQGKLDTLIKKKDYQLLLEMTKNKIAQNMQNISSLMPKSMFGGIAGSIQNKKESLDSSPKNKTQLNQSTISQEITQSQGFSLAKGFGAALLGGALAKHPSKQMLKKASMNSKPTLDLVDEEAQAIVQQSALLQTQQLHHANTLQPLSPIKIVSQTSNESETQSEEDDEDGQQKELQTLIAEGEGKLRKRKSNKHTLTYENGTKSTLCKRYMKLGQCQLGEKCEYAHSKKELQFNSPQEWVDLVKNISQQSQAQITQAIQGSNFSSADAKYLGEKMGLHGMKTLMEACKLDDHRGVEFLINNGANPISQDFKGNDAIYYAVINNSYKALKSLLEQSGSVMATDRVYGKKKRNILTIAAIYSHDIKVLEYLLRNKVHGVKFNVNQTDRFQRNAIYYSLFRNKPEAVHLFIQLSSCSLDIADLHGKYLIDYAQQYNFEEILLELVRGGARLGVKQKKGIEILMYAAQIGNFDIIKALISKNVALTSIDEKTGLNCVMVALQAGKLDLIYKIIDYVINVKAFNQQCREYGETILMKAISRNNTELVAALVNKSGIQIGVLKDNMGKTELIHAVERNSFESTKLIIETAKKTKQDVDMNNYDKRGRTAIIHASINQSVDILRLLLFDYKFPQNPTANGNEQVHVIKWKDDLSKDVCDYAQTDDTKLVLSEYIEKNNLLYPGYFTMMQTIQKKLMMQKQRENYLIKVEAQAQILQQQQQMQQQDGSKLRTMLDVSDLKKIQVQETMRQKTTKNKIKKIEDDINQQSEQTKDEKEQADYDKLEILQQLSQKRIKSLRSIALKFPKLSNLENNPKFKQAIVHLYQDSDLSKFKKDLKNRRTINEILEHHSPKNVLKRYQNKRQSLDDRKLYKNSSGNSSFTDLTTAQGVPQQVQSSKFKNDFKLPAIRIDLIKVQDQSEGKMLISQSMRTLNSKQNNVIISGKSSVAPWGKQNQNIVDENNNSSSKQNILNVKHVLTKIFSEDQLTKYKSLTESLNVNIQLATNNDSFRSNIKESFNKDLPQEGSSSKITNEQSQNLLFQINDKNTQQNALKNSKIIFPQITQKSLFKSGSQGNIITRNMKQQNTLKSLQKESTQVNKKKMIKQVKFDDSDLENQLEDEKEELIELYQSTNLTEKIQQKIKRNFQ
eukprot:403331675